MKLEKEYKIIKNKIKKNNLEIEEHKQNIKLIRTDIKKIENINIENELNDMIK